MSLKVLHLSSEKTWRGGEQQIAYLIEELAKKNVSSFVFCRKESKFEKHCQKENIPFEKATFSNSFDIFSAYKLAEYIQQIQPDLIHAHSARSHALAMLSTFFNKKIALIVSKRTDFPIKDNYFAKWRYNHPQVKKIICVSKKIAEIAAPQIIDHKKLTTVYSGVDSKLLAPRVKSEYFREKFHISKDHFLVGNTSAIADQKDYFTFVDTAQEILNTDKNFHFLIIGSGPMEKEIKDYVSKKALNDFITFTGFIDKAKEKIHELDCFFITSKTEGLGTSIIDAFAAGVPVVGTNAGGIPELIINKETGLLENIGDSVNLSKKIIELKENKKLANQLSTQATLHLKKYFLKEITAEKTYAFYLEALH